VQKLINNQKYAAWVDNITYSFPWFFCFLITYISSFIISGGSAPIADLDQSYQVVLEYARSHNFQFGQDIVFTFGPLGFLNTWVSQGLFPAQRIIFALAWSGVVAWSATGLARQIPGRMKFVFLGWFLIYSNLGWLEQHAFLVMAYGCMILMDDVQRRKGAAATFLSVFAVLALIKFTFFIAVIVSVILCVLVQIGKRNFKSSFAIIICFVSIFLAIWLADGQKIENLFSWIAGSFEIAGGFTDAMTIFPKGKVLITSAIAGALFLASLLVIIRSARLNLRNVGILLVTTAFVFLAWKQGFVRADGHVMFFICFLPIAFAVLLTENFQKNMNRKPRLCIVMLFMSAIILCNWAADFQEPGTMLTKLIDWPGNMMWNSTRIIKCITGDWKYCFTALREDKQLKQEPDLPIARAIVDKASIDVINYRQWAALANNLNYRPRPIIQGYSVYTPYLQDLDLAFYQSEKHPQYLLFKMETIDNRFPALDDATLLPYILKNYKPVAKDGAKDGGFLLLKTLPKTTNDLVLTLVHEHKVAFGESLDMSAYKDKLYIMRVEVKPTVFGKVIKFLFQAPVLTMNTEMNGKTTKYRFIPAMAERGIVISPLLLTNDDVMRYYDGASVNCADSIFFSRPKYALSQLSEIISVKIYKQGAL
jgi:hypothetical protein